MSDGLRKVTIVADPDRFDLVRSMWSLLLVDGIGVHHRPGGVGDADHRTLVVGVDVVVLPGPRHRQRLVHAVARRWP